MKKAVFTSIISIIILTLTIMGFSMLTSTSKVYADSASYDIGDTGPAGGLIFYRDGSTYLEAAPSDQGTSKFSNITTLLIGTTSSSIGTGQANTNAIIAQSGHTESAAKVCADYEQNGYTDWFLPSREALDLMYTNLHLANIGGFGTGYYWSSSETKNTLAWAIWFYNGNHFEFDKGWNLIVRPIRAFTIHRGKEEEEEVVWVRDVDMTCYQVWINEDNNFEFVFWWEYYNNNWVQIFDMYGNLVFEIDMEKGNAHFEADLPDGMYKVKTFHEYGHILQEFMIGKPAPEM
jgi:hypothetical protein